MTAASRPNTSRGPTLVHSQASDEVQSRFDEDRSIGDIIRQIKNLSDEQLAEIAKYQRQHGLRFGESAVAMGLATDSDVVFALSQQFHYPFAPDERRGINPELVTSSQPFSKQAEAFRAIRSQLMMGVFSPVEPKRALTVISADRGDGKTFFVANLGVALAQLGGRTLVVDADLRNPRLHQLFGIPNVSGLSAILSGRQEENAIFQAPDVPSLYIMPVGVTPPNPLELIERPAFRLLMAELLRKFDYVVVDTPAASLGSDAAVITSKCGAALAIARKDRTQVARLKDLSEAVTAAAVKLAGVIVNEY